MFVLKAQPVGVQIAHDPATIHIYKEAINVQASLADNADPAGAWSRPKLRAV